MRYLKMLALAAVAAGALMAFIGAGTASATVLCSTNLTTSCPATQKWPGGTALNFSVKTGFLQTLFDTESEALDSCSQSTLKANITNAGSATATVTSSAEELTWGNCSFLTKTLETGKLEIHRVANSTNGTVTADGTFKFTVNVIFASCVYGVTSGGDLGEITEGNPAIFHVNAVAEEFTKSVLCPDDAFWSGTYALTSPSGTTLAVADS